MYTSNLNNLILNSDSYKTSHWVQYPPGSEYLSSYIEARSGDYDVVFFGLQAFIKEYLSTPITHQDIDEAETIIHAHGLTFNRVDWERLVDKHGGYLPLRIEAIPEGTIAPISNVVCQIVNTDPEFYWLPSYIETALLRAIWYPSTVASVSRYCKSIIRRALEKSADNTESLIFRLHDFGSRGASSHESVAIGSLAHLVNFAGTDSMTALVAASRWYQMSDDMPAFSIPAAEHSTMTAWGRDGETAAFANMIEQFGGEGKTFSVVSDSYDLWNAIDNIWGDTLKDDVKNMGGTLVIRPDSGEPTKVVREALERLAVKFGTTINSKGYKVLPDYVRIIQGDGIGPQSLSKIINVVMDAGFSADNITFGMGGGLLQQVNRDTMSWAMKASAISINGTWKDIYKDPVTSHSKRSKKGRLALIKGSSGQLQTIKAEDLNAHTDNVLRDVYVDGKLLIEDSLTTIRGARWMVNIAKNMLFAPIYLYQGRKIKRDTVRLPEPDGERFGHVELQSEKDNDSAASASNLQTLSLMVVGDSAAAGVGSQTQQEALVGKLIPALQQQPAISTQFNALSWSLQATTGHTSFDILRRLYVLPAPSQPVDVMVLSVGVNDTTANVSTSKWQQQIEDIISIAQRKFGVRELIFLSLPPMAQMPALPAPLNGFMGAKANRLDEILQQVCADHDGVTYMATDFARMIEEHSNGTPIDIAVMFANDGFHPSSITYGYWAQQLAALITQLLNPTSKDY